jgi:hypothetical protein
MIPNPNRAAEIFGRAFDFEPTERPVFLAGACANDLNLRRRVEHLLLAHEAKSGFLPRGDSIDLEVPAGEPQPQTVSMGGPLTVGFALSQDGTRAVSGNAHGIMQLWEAASTEQVETWTKAQDQTARQR